MECFKSSYKKLSLTLFFLLSSSVNALVDYSDEEIRPSPKKAISKPRVKRMSSRQQVKTKSSKLKIISDFELNTNYETIDYIDNKVMKMNMNTHFQTPYNFYLDFEYFTIQSDNMDDEVASSDYQRGNPKALLGLQWLQFGKSEEKVNLDLMVGMSYKSTSPHATSRTDKFIGIQTMKRFHSAALGLSYMMRATGNPSDEQEMDIGNISIFGAEIGVMISNDIQFSLMAKSITIKKSDNLERINRLEKNISFSYVSPRLTLGLGKMVSIDLGAVFQTDRIKDTRSLFPAKLWDIRGVYGNSIFAGLNLTL